MMITELKLRDFFKIFMYLFIIIITVLTEASFGGSSEVVYAVNCGGGDHRDVHGVNYIADPATEGIASDFGKALMIDRAHENDQILYQTERYSLSSFSYDIPKKLEDGEYVAVFKFCEVYFRESNRKVFDVMLNDHKVISELDIFDTVGHGVAHDERIEFAIQNGQVVVGSYKTAGSNGRVKVEFVKLNQDNPKINAFVVYKGKLSDVPKLPPPSKLYEEDEDEDVLKPQTEKKEKASMPKRPSGPKSPNPYESDDSSTMLPIFIAIAAFIPIVFCLCKL